MFSNIFKGGKGIENKEPSIPENKRIYAIGDIHGRVDLLNSIHDVILKDSGSLETECENSVVYLGDYVDRGFESKEVLDVLVNSPLEGFKAIYLKGNHEDLLLNFLEDFSIGTLWFSLGGDATVYSYGVSSPLGVKQDKHFKKIQESLRETLPEEHQRFLLDLKLYHEVGDYLFVHAGIMPGRAMSKQLQEHMMWIRDDFLKHKKDHGKVIVHGHTVTEEPEILSNRIGIDTGACYNGKLTCLVLEGNKKRFLTNSVI